MLLNRGAERRGVAHCGHDAVVDDDDGDDAAATGGVCWPKPSLSFWLPGCCPVIGLGVVFLQSEVTVSKA